MYLFNTTPQFLHEITAWKKLLDCFIQENSFLKTRLSKAVDKENDRQFIARAELFHSEFIVKDELMLGTRKDIREQEKKLVLMQKLKISPDVIAGGRQDRLRNEMALLENEFAGLKSRFDKYLLSCVGKQ